MEKEQAFKIFIYVVLNIRFVLQLCIYINEVSECNGLLLDYQFTNSKFKKAFFLFWFPLYFLVYVPCYFLHLKINYKRQYGARDKMILREWKDKFFLQNPGLIKYNKFGIIASILFGGGVIFMCVSKCSLIDVLSNVSIWFTLFGVSFFKLYEIILKNGSTCSDNFSYQLWKCKQVNFRIVYGYEELAKAQNGVSALIPYTLLFIFSSFFAIPNLGWNTFSPYAIWIVIVLYLICCIRTFLNLKGTIEHTWSIIIAYSIQVIVMVTWYFIVWFLPYLGIQTLKKLTMYGVILLILILILGLTYYYLLKALLEHNKWHLSIYAPYCGEVHNNYFVFEMKDGTAYDSRDKLFYPIIQKNYIRLLFIDGSYLIRTKKEIKFMIIQGVPISHLWRKEPMQMRKRAGYSEGIPMTFKVPGEQL